MRAFGFSRSACAVASGVLLFLALTACSSRVLQPFQMEVQQGNYLTAKEVALLREGMTREQVRFVMGTPLINDIFREDRWDYVFTRQAQNSNAMERRRLTVHFDGEVVRRLDESGVDGVGDARAAQAPR